MISVRAKVLNHFGYICKNFWDISLLKLTYSISDLGNNREILFCQKNDCDMIAKGLSLYSTGHFLVALGADNTIHFALSTLQILFSLIKI